MQYKSNKTLQLSKKYGELINKLRTKSNIKLHKSRLQFCYEYELDPGNLSRIEHGLIDPKLSMLWRIAEALEMPLSEIIKSLENELGDDFHITEQ